MAKVSINNKLSANRLLPVNSRRRKLAGRAKRIAKKSGVLRKLHQHAIAKRDVDRIAPKKIDYQTWIDEIEPKLWSKPTLKGYQPLISIVVPAYNTPDKYLEPLLSSVVEQKYQNWQLCIADGSSDKSRAKKLKQAAQRDKRIVYKRLDGNQGIVGNTNQAIKLAKGQFVCFLDHDDTLSPYALQEVFLCLKAEPNVDILYSDEDKLSDDGAQRFSPFFKPGWSPVLEEAVNYMTHFFVIRRSLLTKVGGLQPGFDGSQDYELILRATDYSKNILHIPKILYHWRLADGSTSGAIDNKSYADDAGQRALAEHVKRQNIPAKVLGIPEAPTNYRLQYQVPKKAKASIIIPFKDKPELLKQCVNSIIKKTAYKNYEIILLSNNSTEPATKKYLDSLDNTPNIKLFYWDHPFNYAALNNFGRQQASGDFMVLLNNDTEVISEDWLSELIGVAAQPNVGAVGAQLFYPNNRLQHAGVILGMNTMAGHVFRNLTEDAISIFGRPSWPRNYLAVTAACLAVEAKKYDEVGGLDEKFVMAGNDVAFCLSLYEKGYLNVYWPFAKLYHYENVSVGSYSKAPASDYDHSLTYYRPYLNWQDPYFNPNLDLMNEQVSIRSNYE